MKEEIGLLLEKERERLCSMSDAIFDRPEMAFEEVFASGLLEDYLEEKGFQVKRGLGSLPTAFRAEYQQGEGSFL